MQSIQIKCGCLVPDGSSRLLNSCFVGLVAELERYESSRLLSRQLSAREYYLNSNWDWFNNDESILKIECIL